ncbi:MAG: peptide ABC transporter substrate-binding protein, partial [Nitrospirae bacterium]
FKIILKSKYPQFIYWLAMPFFAPMPKEAILFYSQKVLIDKNITIDRFPLGTGPYRIERYNPNMEIVLVKNENYHDDYYPNEGDEDDPPELLKDRGKKLPFIDEIVLKLERESIPRWNKFLQGYYDTSGITSDSFDQVIRFSTDGSVELTDFIKKKGIKLISSPRTATYYMGFNMLDETVGGYSEEKQKLRRAISIAIDYNEYIEIFNNGRGIVAMSPIPPGVFGYIGGKEGINPYVYKWDEDKKRPILRSIKEAKELLSEAGYPNGRDREGRPLIINFDNFWTGPEFRPILQWYSRRLKELGIQLNIRTTDYNRFQDKIRNGNFQLYSWGWLADYPDPENFLFLLICENSTVKTGGPNHSNYCRKEYDKLFNMMKNMENSPERMEIIREMVDIIQRDAPWLWGYHPVSFTLHHSWLTNVKPNEMTHRALVYYKIDPKLRSKKIKEWNRPRWRPLLVLTMIFIVGLIPAYFSKKKKRHTL